MTKSNEFQLIDGRYKIIELIGEGGMGRVFKAENIKLNSNWAIKEINKKRFSEIDFLAEPNILKNLSHFNLPRIVDIDENEDYLYIIMDFIEGTNLKDELVDKQKFSEKLVVEWGKQLASVLDYLHSQKIPIIYRDMKPENIMLSTDNSIKLIDFGIAKKLENNNSNEKKSPLTRRYAAPEQLEGNITDGRSDIYSLGLTLYYLITGQKPGEEPIRYKNIRSFDKNLSEGIEHIIAKCTQKDPKDRYQSAKELLRDLNNIEHFNSAYKKLKKIKIIRNISFTASLICFSVLTMYGTKVRGIEINDLYSSLISQGKVLVTEKQYDRAEETFNKAIKVKSETPDAYISLAKLYYDEGDYSKCANYIINEVFPTNSNFKDASDFISLLGNSYYYSKEYDKSVPYFEGLVNKFPDDPQYNRDLAATYVKLNKVEDAEKKLNELIQRGVEEATVLYVKGEILNMKKQYKEAIECFEKSISLTKDQQLKQRLFVGIANIYRDNVKSFENGLDKQIDILERGKTELKDNNTSLMLEMLGAAYNSKASTLKSDKKLYEENLKKSIENFQALLDKGYKMSYIYRNIGMIYQYLEDFKNSEQHLIQAKDIDPADYRNYVQLALLYIDMENKKTVDQRNYDKVKDNYNLAIKYAPNGESSIELNQLKSLISKIK